MYLPVFLLVFLSCQLAAETGPDADREQPLATALWFEQHETGVGPDHVRMLVTEGYLRIDNADPGSGFILFDRTSRTTYSVDHEERSILVLPPVKVARSQPASLRFDEVAEVDTAAPRIAGKQPWHVRLRANDQVCMESVSVPGMLETAARALAEFARSQADRQTARLQDVPADIATPCYLLRYAYGATRIYNHGFPLQEWDGQGYSRMLVNYEENLRAAPGELDLPGGYQRITMPD